MLVVQFTIGVFDTEGKQMIYAGIGARETPEPILKAMRSIARYLAKQGCSLRSGGARGADTAFEQGCDLANGKKQIFLPYKYFNRNDSSFFAVTKEARLVAKKYHPGWEYLSDRGRDYMGRNAFQVLGLSLLTPANFIVCWTPNGQVVGGTGQALRMAKDFHIPIFNLGSMTLGQIDQKLPAFLEKHSCSQNSFETEH